MALGSKLRGIGHRKSVDGDGGGKRARGERDLGGGGESIEGGRGEREGGGGESGGGRRHKVNGHGKEESTDKDHIL